MKTIPLTQGKVALVDDVDYDELNRFKWSAHYRHNNWYAARNGSSINGKRKFIYMHREILGLKPGDGIKTDHKNHNGLANWRDNLRICTNAENLRNKKPKKGCTSQYKGVCWHKDCHKWVTHIKINNHYAHLGLFTSEIEAAKAYDAAAIRNFGEFALLNFNHER